MDYWLVRAKWGGDNLTEKFLQNDEWINGYDDKYLDIVNRVQEGDILLLADSSLVNYYATCVDNELNGQNITVDSWKKIQEPIVFPAKGAYIKTIVKVNDIELIEKSKLAIEELKTKELIIIKSIELKNFTLFKNHRLEFSNGINILIGENGTGKTQLLKLLYALMQSNNISSKISDFRPTIEKKIKNVLRPENIKNLIRKEEKESSLSIDLDRYIFKFNFTELSTHLSYIEQPIKNYNKKALFLPAKEILSFYTGFRSIYRQTSFDETFDDLALSLGKLVPKNRYYEKFEEEILKNLEEILGGKIILENDRFYLIEKDKTKREITLVAEGLRKLGTIFHLIANETIEKGSVIFWDEPEANLNPKIIKYVAKMILELERAGVQIFIATHSLFLINEIEIIRKKEHDIKYFSFGFDKKNELRISQSPKLEELKDLILLDEELDQGDRFMNKER